MLMVDSRNVNAGRLIDYNLETGEFEVIAEDPTYDVGDVMMHPDTYEIEAVSFIRAREEWEVIHESVADDLAAIRGIDDGDFTVVSRFGLSWRRSLRRLKESLRR